MERKIIIFMPGIMGSKLKLRGKKGKTIYPSTFWDYFCGRMSVSNFKQILTAPLEAHDILRKTKGIDVYASFIKFLTGLGYTEFNPMKVCTLDGTNSKKKYTKRLYTLPYNWMQSIEVHTRALANFIVSLVKSERTNKNKLSITLIGHSFGGLVQRAYLESSIKGISNDYKIFIKAFIGIAVPNEGSNIALEAIKGEHHAPFFSRAQIFKLANSVEKPCLYELLPTNKTYENENLLNNDSMEHFHRARQLLNISKCPKNVHYYFVNGVKKSCKTSTNKNKARVDQFGKRIEATEGEIRTDGCVTLPGSDNYMKCNRIYINTAKTHRFILKSKKICEKIKFILENSP